MGRTFVISRGALPMSKSINKFSRGARRATLSVFLGFGLTSCADDSGQVEDPIQNDEVATTEYSQQEDMYGDSNVSLDSDDGIVTANEIDEDLVIQSDDEAPLEYDQLSDNPDEEIAQNKDFLLDDSVEEDSSLPADSYVAGDAVENQEPTYQAEESADEMLATAEESYPSEDTYQAEEADNSQVQNTVSEPAYQAEKTGNSGVYVIQAGDSLGKISTKIYGTAQRWMELAQANNISDPRKIFPGDELSFELIGDSAARFAKALSTVITKEVVVSHGDTLASLAKQVLGPKASWKQLYAYNKAKISNPNRIFVGMRLKYVPSEEIAKISGVNGSPQNTVEGEQIAADIGD